MQGRECLYPCWQCQQKQQLPGLLPHGRLTHQPSLCCVAVLLCSMWTTAAVGALCVAVFCWGQSFCSVYRGRLVSMQGHTGMHGMAHAHCGVLAAAPA